MTGAGEEEKSGGKKMRINRALALCGLGARREVESLVSAGRVTIKGRVVTDLSSRIDPYTEKIEVDGKRVHARAHAYYAFYKPRGVITTMRDEKGRECVGDIIKREGLLEPVKPAGRLDRRSEGLLVLTNDGALAQRLLHPSANVRKVYRASLDRPISDADVGDFLSGIELDDGPARMDGLSHVRDNPKSVVYSITVHEGRNRLIRRMFGKKGYRVKRLVRVEFAGVLSAGLTTGEVRKLSKGEVEKLESSGRV